MANKANFSIPKLPVRANPIKKSTTSTPLFEEEDDFEASFLSDVRLPSKFSHLKTEPTKTTKLSSEFKPKAKINPDSKPINLNSTKIVSSEPVKDFFDDMNRTKVFLNSNLPLLDMDNKLYQTLLEQYKSVRNILKNPNSLLLDCLSVKNLRSYHPKELNLSTINIARELNQHEYEEGLLTLSEDTRNMLKHVFLG